MKRRQFIQRVAGLSGVLAVQPWRLLDLLGVESVDEGRARLLDWDLPAQAAILPTWTNKTGSSAVISNMATLWAKHAGTGTVAYSATAGVWPDGTMGGLVMTQDTNGGALVARATLAAPVDLTRTGCIALKFTTTNGVTPQAITVILGDGGFTNYYYAVFNSSSYTVSPEGNTLVLDRAAWTADGSPSWATIDRVQIQVDSLGGTQSTVVIKGLWSNVVSRPTVMLWFDDCNSTDYTNCYPVLSALGLRANIAFLSDQLNVNNYLSTAQCDTLYAAGWDFTNHTMTHPVLTSVTAQQVADEFDGCAAVLSVNGWTRGNRVVVYPTGATNGTVDAVAESRFTIGRGGRTTFTNFQQATFGGLDYPLRLVTNATLDNDTTTLAQAQTAVQNCIRLGSTLNVFCHLVTNGGSGTTWELDTKFTPFAHYLAGLKNAGRLDVQTVTDWASELTSGRKTRYT